MSGDLQDAGATGGTLLEVWCDPSIAAELMRVDWGADASLRATIATLPETPELRSPVLAIPPEAGPLVAGVLIHIVATSADALPAHLIGEAIYDKVVCPLLRRLRRGRGSAATAAKESAADKPATGDKRELHLTITFTGPNGTSRLDVTWGPTSNPTDANLPDLVATVATSPDGTRVTLDLPGGRNANVEPKGTLHRGRHPSGSDLIGNEPGSGKRSNAGLAHPGPAAANRRRSSRA